MLRFDAMPRLADLFAMLFAMLAVSFGAPANAGAAIVCQEVGLLIEQAKRNFVGGTSETSTAVEATPLTGSTSCSPSLALSGANSYHCAWMFDYRSDAAKTTYEDFNRTLQGCFSENTDPLTDHAVNHPDYYEQQQYRLDGVAVTVSIKDKSELRSTFVFVGIHGSPAD